MKYLILLAVVIGVLWFARSRNRAKAAKPAKAESPPRPAPGDTGAKAAAPAPMLACAHCGVHLPQAEAQFDASGRPFCSEAHRLAGPR